MESQKRRTWAEVSLQNLGYNYRALGETLTPGCKIMAMVKSDAYGHGALPIALELQNLGADYLGVACLDEALELRQGGVTLPILVLGGTLEADYPLLLEHDLAQAVFSREAALALSQAAVTAGKTLTVHIKVDTGMSRLGLFSTVEHLEAAAQIIAEICNLPGLAPQGIFTHFADSDGDEDFTMTQLCTFLDLLALLEAKGRVFPLRHGANSAAALLYPCTHLDMVRCGLTLYGHYLTEELEPLCPLRPVMEVKSRIISLKTLPEGAGVSYGRTHTLERESTLAVIPIGYGDGFLRSFSDAFTIGVHGVSAPILGRVCMDMCMVDVTGLEWVSPGDEVVVYSADPESGQALEVAAQKAGTIPYELLCVLSKRIPRLYF